MLRAIVLLNLFLGLPVIGGVVLTVDGRRLEGDVRVDPSGTISVAARDDSTQQLSLMQVFSLKLGSDDVRPRLARGIELADGRALAGRLEDSDSQTIAFKGSNGRSLTFPLNHVARLIFQVDHDRLPITGHKTGQGALLDNDDFLAGLFIGMSNGVVTLDTTLLGRQLLATDRQVKAVVLNDAREIGEPCVMRLSDGTVAGSAELRFVEGEFRVEDPVLGAVASLWKQVHELRLHGNRAESLLRVKSASTFSANELPDGTSAELIGGTPRRCIAIRSGDSATFELDGRYESLHGAVGVPRKILPIQAIRFRLVGDGRELFISSPLTSVDDSMGFSIPVGGLKRLELSVMNAGTSQAEIPGIFADPILLRRE